jgi:hypothetical protein
MRLKKLEVSEATLKAPSWGLFISQKYPQICHYLFAFVFDNYAFYMLFCLKGT